MNSMVEGSSQASAVTLVGVSRSSLTLKKGESVELIKEAGRELKIEDRSNEGLRGNATEFPLIHDDDAVGGVGLPTKPKPTAGSKKVINTMRA